MQLGRFFLQSSGLLTAEESEGDEEKEEAKEGKEEADVADKGMPVEGELDDVLTEEESTDVAAGAEQAAAAIAVTEFGFGIET